MNVEDFFAKKDKSKKVKTKAKFTTIEVIAKKLEESGSPSEVTGKTTSAIRPAPETATGCESSTISKELKVNIEEDEDDEWDCAADQKQKDYSGLKVQAYLSVSEKFTEEDLIRESDIDFSNDAETNASAGPWKIISTSLENASDKEQKQSEVDTKTTNGLYRPPAIRRRIASEISFSPRPLSVKKETALELSCEKQFPTLGSTVEQETKTFSTKINKHSRYSKSNFPLNSNVSRNLKKFSSLRLDDSNF